MKLSVKYLRINPYNQNPEEVPVGTEYGFWRVVEHTGAGWFEWEGLHRTEEEAEAAMKRALEAEELKYGPERNLENDPRVH